MRSLPRQIDRAHALSGRRVDRDCPHACRRARALEHQAVAAPGRLTLAGGSKSRRGAFWARHVDGSTSISQRLVESPRMAEEKMYLSIGAPGVPDRRAKRRCAKA